MHYILAAFLSLVVAAVGLCILIWMSFDALQMQGTLVEYSFSDGHLVYLSQGTARQNTLLLHESTDSVDFVFEKGTHTKNVTLKLEHLQLENRTLSIPLLPSGEDAQPVLKYQLSLPQGPLYSRVTVEAQSTLRIKPTKYTFHLVCVGEAIELSLAGEAADPDGINRVPFAENRRWQYQTRNAEWYVPNLSGDSTLQVKLLAISFAPLLQVSEEDKRSNVFSGRPQLPHYGNKCLCGEEEAGFGNGCLMEETIPLGAASSLVSSTVCLFLQSAKDDIQLQDRTGSVSGGRGLVQWLQDVTISGKRARLRMDGAVASGWSLEKVEQFAELSDQNVSKASEFRISNVFAKTMPSTLLMRGNQLVIGTTQDETNIENEALPFRVVLHAPPVVLNATPPGFLLPHFDFNNKQYALCAASKIDQLNASVPDARFHVVPHAVQVMGRDCLHHPIMQKSFRAERTNSCKYCSWYIVADQDDVQATLSPEACILEAIDLNDPVALKKILSDFSSAFLRAKGKTCNVLQKVIRLERWELLPDVAKHFDVDCHGCKETPLGVAAAEGRVEALKRLLAKDVGANADTVDKNGFTALARAVQHCQLDAASFLIQEGSDVNHLMPPFPGAQCPVTPLLSLCGRFGVRDDLQGQGACHAQDRDSTKKDHVASMILLLKRSGANFSVEGRKDCLKRTALMEAINSKSLPEVELMLQMKADPNEEGDAETGQEERPLMALVDQFLSHKSIDWESFVQYAAVLLQHGADVNYASGRYAKTALMKAAAACHTDMVKFLIQQGASIDLKDAYNETARDDAEYFCEDTANSKVLELLPP